MRLSVYPRVGAAVGGLCLLLAACSSGSKTAAPSSTAPPAARTLTVFLAGSLSERFNALGKQFEADNPGVTVKFSSTGSSDLAKQIVAGAPADVFAPAGDSAMKAVTDAMKTEGPPVIFASNVLEIATAPGNPKGISSFADLAKPDVKVAVCDPTAACGMATILVEQAARVTLNPVSEEQSLKAVVSDVTAAKADAGLVYATDVVAAKSAVQGVMFPESSKAPTNYPIAVVKGSPQSDLAKKFVDLVTGPMGQMALKASGFATK